MYLMPQIMIDVWYLQKIPNQKNPIILGCQWLRVAWNPSRQLVWASGERFPMSFNSSLVVSKLVSLSKATEYLQREYILDLCWIIIIKVIGSDSVKTLLLSLIGFVVVLNSIIPRIVLLIYYISFFFVKLKKKNKTKQTKELMIQHVWH